MRGPPPGPIREAIHAYVKSVALYNAEVWYPGETYTKGCLIRTKAQVGKIERAIASACQATVLAYSTTPNNAILREASILPARVLLEATRRR